MEKTKAISVENIIEIVADFYGISVKDMLGRRRKGELIKPRHIVAYLLREELRMSYPAIGRKLGARDHTTAIHAYQKIKTTLEKDPTLQREIENIRTVIRGGELRLLWKPKEVVKEVVKEKTPTTMLPELQWKQMIEKAKMPVSPIVREREKSMLEEWRSGKTLEQIGKEWKLTRERIRQIISKAIFREIADRAKDGLEIDIGEFLKEEKVKHETLRDRQSGKLKIGEKITETKTIKEPKRWSRFYARCRICGTTKIPHFKRGLCDRCFGIFRGERRERIIAERNSCCESCGLERGDVIRKFGKDFYIVKDKTKGGTFKILCRECFLRATGKIMGRRPRN